MLKAVQISLSKIYPGITNHLVFVNVMLKRSLEVSSQAFLEMPCLKKYHKVMQSAQHPSLFWWFHGQ